MTLGHGAELGQPHSQERGRGSLTLSRRHFGGAERGPGASGAAHLLTRRHRVIDQPPVFEAAGRRRYSPGPGLRSAPPGRNATCSNRLSLGRTSPVAGDSVLELGLAQPCPRWRDRVL